MNKILVSGLALGADPNIQTCNVCNYDLSWLFNYPSTLLWADKIILTPEILDTIKNSTYYPGENDDMGKAIRLIFEGLEKHGLIEIKTPSDIITDEVVDEIYKQMDLDKAELELRFPKAIKDIEDIGVPGQFSVDGTEYCRPALWTNYASLILAKEWKANILFSEHSKIYFNRLFQLKSNQKSDASEKIHAFDEIFRVRLPEYELFPLILFDAKLCTTCTYERQCKSDVLYKIENNINKALEWRTYDEINQLKEVLQKISNDAKNVDINANDLINTYKDEELKIKKNIKSVFPKVKRWSNMATILSIPLVVAGVSADLPLMISIGAGTAGAATIVSKYLDIYKSKYRWVGHTIVH